jgi:flagellar biosynthesis/type III secretory pathway protein FliH
MGWLGVVVAAYSAYQQNQNAKESRKQSAELQNQLIESQKAKAKDDTRNAAQSEAMNLMKRRGMMSTMLTGPQGITGGQSLKQATLGA